MPLTRGRPHSGPRHPGICRSCSFAYYHPYSRLCSDLPLPKISGADGGLAIWCFEREPEGYLTPLQTPCRTSCAPSPPKAQNQAGGVSSRRAAQLAVEEPSCYACRARGPSASAAHSRSNFAIPCHATSRRGSCSTPASPSCRLPSARDLRVHTASAVSARRARLRHVHRSRVAPPRPGQLLSNATFGRGVRERRLASTCLATPRDRLSLGGRRRL